MGITTIQWADYTFNPWVGCQRVSPGVCPEAAEAVVRANAPREMRRAA